MTPPINRLRLTVAHAHVPCRFDRIVSTSALVQRLSVEQTAIESRLLELEGIEEIRNSLKNANINSDEVMPIDAVQPEPRVIDAKRRALSRYVRPCDCECRTRVTHVFSCQAPLPSNGATHQVEALNLHEAMELEQRAHAIDMERQQRSDDRRRRIGLPVRGEILSRQETEARIWAFMSVSAACIFK